MTDTTIVFNRDGVPCVRVEHTVGDIFDGSPEQIIAAVTAASEGIMEARFETSIERGYYDEVEIINVVTGLIPATATQLAADAKAKLKQHEANVKAKAKADLKALAQARKTFPDQFKD